MNALQIFEFPQDPNLRVAYRAYEALLESFQVGFKRSPSCGLCVGIVGDHPNQRSIVTARWDDSKDKILAASDAKHLFALAESLEYNRYP